MANVKTSDESAASALTGTELLRAVQSGSNVQTTTGAVALSVSDADTTLAADSDLKYATQKAVKAYIDALASSSSAWGDITGTLASQTDLQAALDLKQARSPSIQTISSSATVTPTFADDIVTITAQAAGLTIANPTGTAIPCLGMVIRIKDNGTARAISYDTQYRAIGVTLPTTTVISKTLYLAMIWNATDTKFDVVAVGQES